MRDPKNSVLKPMESKPAVTKAPYVVPTLRTYGAVNQLTAGRNGSGGDRSSQRRRNSERAMKQDIARVGTHPAGFGLYLFDYKPEFREAAGYGRQFGVMADEVEGVIPEAVVLESDGRKRVDYAMLGIELAGPSTH